MSVAKEQIIEQLKKDILFLQGHKSGPDMERTIGLGPVEAAFPNRIFPRAAVHEFISGSAERAVSSGFIAALLASLLKNGSIGIWIGTERIIFPPALKAFGVDPERMIFIDLKRGKDVLWVLEEALKCEGIAAVIGEIPEISFTDSLRLQHAVESSRVTGFLLRNNPRNIEATACAARWKISFLPSELANKMPGVGHPRWGVELLKVRNGTTGYWEMEWSSGLFIPVKKDISTELHAVTRKIG